MSLTPGALTFTADSFEKDQVRYIGVLNSATIKDSIALARTLPSPTPVYSGNLRTLCKVVRTLTLTGALTPSGDFIAEVRVQCPVGASSADVGTIKAVVADMVTDADFLTLVRDGKISY